MIISLLFSLIGHILCRFLVNINVRGTWGSRKIVPGLDFRGPTTFLARARTKSYIPMGGITNHNKFTDLRVDCTCGSASSLVLRSFSFAYAVLSFAVPISTCSNEQSDSSNFRSSVEQRIVRYPIRVRIQDLQIAPRLSRQRKKTSKCSVWRLRSRWLWAARCCSLSAQRLGSWFGGDCDRIVSRWQWLKRDLRQAFLSRVLIAS